MKAQSRNSETRAQDLRDLPFEFEPDAALSLPPGVYREGYSYRYLSVNNIEPWIKKGYALIELSRVTGPVFIDPTKKNPLADKYYTLKDTVLAEIPTIQKNRLEDFYNKKAHDRNKIEGVTDTAPNYNRF